MRYACNPSANPIESTVRFVGPNSRTDADYAQGRVEVQKGGAWGTICRRGWGKRDAGVRNSHVYSNLGRIHDLGKRENTTAV